MPNRSSGDRTKIILANSLRNLMKKKPVDKIKIREIVEDCDLNRQTFYYHFQDMYALIEWMYRYDGQQIIGETFDGQNVLKTTRAFLEYVEEHREEIISVLESKAQVYFSNFLKEGIGVCCDIVIDKYSKNMKITREYKSFLSIYYTSAVLGVALDWIKKGDSSRLTSDELLQMFVNTTTGSLELALNNYKAEDDN